MLRKYILLCCYGSLPKNKLLSPHKSGPLKTQAPPPQFPAKQQFQKNLHSWGGGGAVGGGGGGSGRSGGAWPETKGGRKKNFWPDIIHFSFQQDFHAKLNIYDLQKLYIKN